MKGLVVVVLICGGWWWFWGRTAAPVKVIEAQLQALDKRDFASAYGYLASKTKAVLTPEEFQERVVQHGPVMNRANSTFFSRSIDNGVATISGTIEALDKSKTEARYVLIQEGDRWAIESFSFR